MPEFCVYISCVGEQDPVSEKTNEEGALLTCFRYLTTVKQITFNTVYLIPTSKSLSPARHTEERAQQCAEEIQQNYPNLQIIVKPLEVQNPADLKQVYPKMRELLGSILNEVSQSAQNSSIVFHINISSGTPQMKESLPFLVSVGQLGSHEVYLWQVFDPRGGAMDLAERVQRAPELDFLTQERILLRLEQLAEHHLYQEANGWLKSALTVNHLPFAQQLYRVLAAHDQWLYKEAANQLQKVLSSHQVPDFLQDWLNQVSNWLRVLAQGLVPKDKLAIDRYYCARRRFVNALFPDVVSHSWTACELALEKHGEEIGVLMPGESPSASELVERLKNSQSVLNQRFCQVPDRRGLLDAVNWLRRIRNDVEHGSRAVNQQIAEYALQIAQTLLTALGWEREMQNCPLHPDLVKKNLLSLIQAMRDSLWR